MTTPVFPTFPGITFPTTRSEEWNNQKTDSVSGKSTTVAYWSTPRYSWELDFEMLRNAAGTPEFQTFFGFMLNLKNNLGPFLYADSDDYAVTSQAIATGDGVTKDFQLKRTFGAGGFTFTENVYAPNTSLTKVAYVAGTPTAVTWNDYDHATKPGQITFAAAPAGAAAITADFSYYFPCEGLPESLKHDFKKQMSTYYETSFKFRSIK